MSPLLICCFHFCGTVSATLNQNKKCWFCNDPYFSFPIHQVRNFPCSATMSVMHDTPLILFCLLVWDASSGRVACHRHNMQWPSVIAQYIWVDGGAWSNLRFNVWRSFVTKATYLPSCFSIQFLEQLLKFLVNVTLLKYVKSQRSYGFLITKELILGFQILDLKDHFSASLKSLFRGGLSTGSWDEFRVLGESRYPRKMFWGPSRGSGGMFPQKILKMEPLRLAKNAFPAYSYGHEVS